VFLVLSVTSLIAGISVLPAAAVVWVAALGAGIAMGASVLPAKVIATYRARGSGFRTRLREGLTNVHRHANAAHVSIEIALRKTGKGDVVVVNIVGDGTGSSETRAILAKHLDARILVLSTFAEDRLLFSALRAGARGYLLKDASAAELAAAIRHAALSASLPAG
jgi:DNA-binding NarL/FixJ family response regulator